MTNLSIDYNPSARRCRVVVEFEVTSAEQLAKPELKASVIEHHLLTHDLPQAVSAVSVSLLTHQPDAIESNVQDNPALAE